MSQEPLYYIQHKGYVGNCLLWWCTSGHGYTTNLDKARQVPKSEAEDICRSRPEQDKPRLSSLVDARAHRHLDCEVARPALLDSWERE